MMGHPFRVTMREDEKTHCRLDLHKTQAGEMTAEEFIRKWGERLDVHLINNPQSQNFS